VYCANTEDGKPPVPADRPQQALEIGPVQAGAPDGGPEVVPLDRVA
jgi:hypothetical protein